MPASTPQETPEAIALPVYRSILAAVDSSDHSNRGVTEAIDLARRFGGRLSACHVYAAKLHDTRFRQMEGGLPEQFREEQELERQRAVHDDLITRGLSIITDSFLDQVEHAATAAGLSVTRRSLEGKNYRELVNETNSGDYDLLIMGALGLGAVESSRLGSVCQRVARRSAVDTLFIKQPARPLSEGPIIVAVDGSTKSYGGLLTALSLAAQWQTSVKAVSAFDPYYHYVAFNRIAGVLSEESGKVFRFKEQEQLHEEIIDSGLAKIYQGHLAVAQSIASDYGVELESVLLDGKPHDVIARYLREARPSLLVMGTTGIHADPGLDIGGNAEYLLNDADCNVLLSQREHRPRVDRLASVSTTWTREAEARMERVPEFVRPMARMAILRFAQERRHTVITEGIVEEATAQLMPGHAQQAMEQIVAAHDRGEPEDPRSAENLRWSDGATRLLLGVKELSLRGTLSMRAEKRARMDGADTVEAGHISPFLEPTPAADPRGPVTKPDPSGPTLHWQSAALARLMRVPEGFMRNQARARIESYTRANGHNQVTLAIAEAGLALARREMESSIPGSAGQRATPAPPAETRHTPAGDDETADQPRRATAGCPFHSVQRTGESSAEETVPRPAWDAGARNRLHDVPAGFCRDMTRQAAETIAGQKGLDNIDIDFVEGVLETFKAGSAMAVAETMEWEQEARERIARAPDMVRGMLVREIEGWSRRQGLKLISGAAVDAVKATWVQRGVFHLDPSDPRSGPPPERE